jgi:hypothetical protein
MEIVAGMAAIFGWREIISRNYAAENFAKNPQKKHLTLAKNLVKMLMFKRDKQSKSGKNGRGSWSFQRKRR